MTELAYLADPDAAYVRSFRARIAALPPGGVVLDRTFFYPTGGGQPSDRGWLALGGDGPVEVTDVRRSGPTVVHRVRGPAAVVHRLAVGSEVEGTLDWARRHEHMRLHTVQHLLSARVFAREHLRTRRAQLGDGRATIDLEGPLDPAAVEALSRDLASALEEPRTVSVREVARAEWERAPLAGRSGLVPLPPQVDPVRVVEIAAWDVCPCGGTHVRSTGEIGPLRLEPPVSLDRGDSRLVLRLVRGGPPTPSG